VTCQNLIDPSYISTHYWTQGSRSSTCDQHSSTLRIHSCTQSVHSCVVWTKNYKTSLVEEDDIEMTGDGEGSDKSSRDEDYFEKQMRLVNESDKTTVRPSPYRKHK
jgi:hypothetical protein